jgi:hypothetical protein
MRAFRSAPIALAVVACRGGDAGKPGPTASVASPPAPSLAPVTSAPTAAAPAAPAPSASDASPAIDFDDQFAYGGIDAGAGDPARLTARPGYAPYQNARFGFSLDVPRAFDAMPEPTNGDGLQWRLGRLAAMTASGMYAVPEVGLSCARSPHVVSHRESKTSCWSTGKRDGWIFWEREVIAGDVLYSLRFQYAVSLKSEMDPIVTHVNASWKVK